MLDPALASLVGAAVGGSLVIVGNVFVEQWRARREERGEAERVRRAARRAARLLAEELRYARRLVAESSERGSYSWEPPKRELPTAAWSEYRADLAAFGSDEDWRLTATAFGALDRLNWHLRGVIEEEGWLGTAPEHPLQPRSLAPSARLDQALKSVDKALTRLDALALSEQSALGGKLLPAPSRGATPGG